MRPRSASTLRRTTSMPTPRPDDLGDLRRRSRIPAGRSAGGSPPASASRPRATRPRSIAVAPDPIGVEPGAVVGDLDDDAARPGGRRSAAARATAGLPAAARCGARLDAVVDAVADHVHQRIGDVLDHLAIELGVLAGQHQRRSACRTAALKSRTSRAIFWNVCRIGTMRIAIALRCSSLVMRFSCAEARVETLVARCAPARDLRRGSTAR